MSQVVSIEPGTINDNKTRHKPSYQGRSRLLRRKEVLKQEKELETLSIPTVRSPTRTSSHTTITNTADLADHAGSWIVASVSVSPV